MCDIIEPRRDQNKHKIKWALNNFIQVGFHDYVDVEKYLHSGQPLSTSRANVSEINDEKVNRYQVSLGLKLGVSRCKLI